MAISSPSWLLSSSDFTTTSIILNPSLGQAIPVPSLPEPIICKSFKEALKYVKVGMYAVTFYLDKKNTPTISMVGCVHKTGFFYRSCMLQGIACGDHNRQNERSNSWRCNQDDWSFAAIETKEIHLYPKDSILHQITEVVSTGPKKEEPVAEKEPTFDPKVGVDAYVEALANFVTDKERLKWIRIFKRCVLPAETRNSINEVLTMVLCRDKFESWGVFSHFEKGLTNAILIAGPPGTGKSMICESISAVLGKNLMILTSQELQSSLVGQMEKNIGEAFTKAKNEDAVIMLDECDSLLYDRSTVGNLLAAEISCLMRAIENFDGVVLLTTNRLGYLDPALQRRIIAKVELPLPNKPARLEIWKTTIPDKVPLEGEIDYSWLSNQPLSGGEIKNAVLLAIRKAIAAGADVVGMDDLKHAVRHVLDGANSYLRAKPGRIGYTNVVTS